MPIEEPRLDAIEHGGHRMGDPAPKRRERPQRPERQEPQERIATQTTRPGAPEQRKPKHGKKSAESLYVANLSWGVTEDDVAALFERYGDVHQATINTDRRTGRSKGFGFVDMPGPAARTAAKKLHGTKLKGRDLTVRLAKPRSHRG